MREGTEAIAKWRRENPDTPLDLRGANLEGARLAGAELVGANLVDSNLAGATLSEAVLTGTTAVGANLESADLCQANMVAANLRGGDLARADLREADLRGSNLVDADLSQARLDCADLLGANLVNARLVDASLVRASLVRVNFRGADFRRTLLDYATLSNTIFFEVDFSTVRGLLKCQHRAPTCVSIESASTIASSIRSEFLKSCGYQPEYVEQLAAVFNSLGPIRFQSVFISYAEADSAFCRALHSRLGEIGVKTWFAPEDMKRGEFMEAQIDEQIGLHDRLVVVISERSMDSTWVCEEILRARSYEKKYGRKILFPIRLCSFEALKGWRLQGDGGEDVARLIRQYFVADFTDWESEESFNFECAKLAGALEVPDDDAASFQ